MGTKQSGPPGVELRSGVKSESIRIKFMYRGAECRETLKLAHTKANIKYAERLRGEILNAIQLRTFSYAEYFPESPQLKRLGMQPKQHQMTVGDLMEDQFRLYERTLSARTLAVYRRIYQTKLKPKWGKALLSEATPAALRAWIGEMSVSARSIRQVLIPLRGAFDLGVNDDLIESNPLDRVKLKKILDRDAHEAKSVTDPFSADEIQAILRASDGQCRNVFAFAFSTGMRPSEYIALKWGSVDWIEHTIKVERTRVNGDSRDEVKTRAAKRLIDMRQGALEALVAQRPHTALANDEIFHDPITAHGWLTSQRVALFWEAALKRAGVRYRNLYQTRHTFASTLLSTGENLFYVAKQMGHTDTTMITRTYGRWIEQEDGVLPVFYERVNARKKTAAL
ncbi:hypothetical protein CD932_19085 [Janthinobacterium sp. PC23-8]|nr:hypothetical protein CD932_19085 [Janthinobacterium sp. PC23-8]